MRICMVEDDRTIAFATGTYLKKYGMEVDVFRSLEDFKRARLADYDLFILDGNLPDGSGFDLLKKLREKTASPFLMLTVKDGEGDILKGFSLGADEYITKPFSLPVLKARIDNIFKRREKLEDFLLFEDLTLDKGSRTVKLKGRDLSLSKQEFDLLFILLENPGRVVLRENLIDGVRGEGAYEVNDNTLTVTIKRLREKLGPYGENIQTIRGMGYGRKKED